MPKYKITIWDTTSQHGRCIIEASSEDAAIQTARQVMWSGDKHGKIDWVIDDGEFDFDVANAAPDVEPDFNEADYKEAE
jgi:hypothetical protein